MGLEVESSSSRDAEGVVAGCDLNTPSRGSLSSGTIIS